MKAYINQLEAHIQNINFNSESSADKESVETETGSRRVTETFTMNDISKASDESSKANNVNEQKY